MPVTALSRTSSSYGFHSFDMSCALPNSCSTYTLKIFMHSSFLVNNGFCNNFTYWFDVDVSLRWLRNDKHSYCTLFWLYCIIAYLMVCAAPKLYIIYSTVVYIIQSVICNRVLSAQYITIKWAKKLVKTTDQLRDIRYFRRIPWPSGDSICISYI